MDLWLTPNRKVNQNVQWAWLFMCKFNNFLHTCTWGCSTNTIYMHCMEINIKFIYTGLETGKKSSLEACFSVSKPLKQFFFWFADNVYLFSAMYIYCLQCIFIVYNVCLWSTMYIQYIKLKIQCLLSHYLTQEVTDQQNNDSSELKNEIYIPTQGHVSWPSIHGWGAKHAQDS